MLKSGRVRPEHRPALRFRRLRIEALEDRRLLSAAPMLYARDATPLAVIGTTPELTGTLGRLSTIDVTFNKPIDPSSFGAQDVGLLDLAHLDVSQLGSFGGAFQDCVMEGSLLYAATGAGLQILDVSNPGAVARLGGYNTSDSARDVAVVGSTAYVAGYSWEASTAIGCDPMEKEESQ